MTTHDDSDKWATAVDPGEYDSHLGDSTADNSVDKWAAPAAQVEYSLLTKDDYTAHLADLSSFTDSSDGTDDKPPPYMDTIDRPVTLLSVLVLQGEWGSIANGITGGGGRYCRNSGKGGRGFHFWKIDRDFF